MDKARMMKKALLLANVKMARECKERGKKQVKKGEMQEMQREINRVLAG